MLYHSATLSSFFLEPRQERMSRTKNWDDNRQNEPIKMDNVERSNGGFLLYNLIRIIALNDLHRYRTNANTGSGASVTTQR